MRVRAQGKKGGAGAKKEGSKAPKEKRDKVKAAAPPKDLTGKGAEKTEQQLKAEEGAGRAVLDSPARVLCSALDR